MRVETKDMRKQTDEEFRKQMMAKYKVCELCGGKRGLEVHHLIPKVCELKSHNLDTEDNCIVVCTKCHAMLTPRKELQKYGIEKAKYFTRLLGEFYERIGKNEDCVNAVDVCDLVDDLCHEICDFVGV